MELWCPRGIAAVVYAKNVPPARFLDAATVLQEIIFSEEFMSRKSLRLSGLFIELWCPRGIAAAVYAKNVPPARFLTLRQFSMRSFSSKNLCPGYRYPGFP